MNARLNRRSLCGQRAAALIVALVALCFSSAPRAHAQSGGPGKDHGVVQSIDDMNLDISGGGSRSTRTYTETDQTRWLNKNGQPIDPGDTVGKTVDVRWRWITGGSEALEVRLSGGGSNSSGSSRSRSEGGNSFTGTWRNPENGHTLKITVNGDRAVLDHSPGSPDEGWVRGNLIYFEGFAKIDGQLRKARGNVSVSSDGMTLTLHDAIFDSDGNVIQTRTLPYTRMR